MGKTVSQTLDSLMPAALDKERDEFYKAFIGDSDADSGALTNEIRDVTSFIDYYTRTHRVDEAETSLLEFIIYIFSGLTRHYSEPDEYLRLRYKALVERKKTSLWNSKQSIKSVFSYFFNENDIYLIERYPVKNMVINGDFDTLESWDYNTADTEFSLIYSRSFEGGSALYINPDREDNTGYIEQRIFSVPAGLYELVFFFSSPKKGIGDIQFSIRDETGKYWNGSSWSAEEFLFYETAHIDTAGYYRSVQRTVNILAATNITLRFKNKNGNGVLVDSVRFGRIEEPAFRVYVTAEPELFFDGTVKADKKYNFSGFRNYYIAADMGDILHQIKPAGVYAEMTVLSSRLNIPWDRILLRWESEVRTRWHILFDGSKSFNSGGVYFINLLFDGTANADSEYFFDGKKMVRYTNPTDLLAGPPLYSNVRTYKKKFTLQTNRDLYFDGRIGANGKFNFTGNIIGVKVGYTMCQVTKRVTFALDGQACFNGEWTANSDLKFDGKYIWYQNGIETYLVKEVL